MSPRPLLLLLLSALSVLGTTDAFAQMNIQVKVAQTATSSPVSGSLVTLQAVRAKGPFETEDPKPARTWTATTNAQGIATFSEIPDQIQTQGLRLQAVTAYNNLTFKSATATPTDGITLELPIFERAGDLRALRLTNVRMIVEPWEDHLVFSQILSLGVQGTQALDTEMVEDRDISKDGIPLELPLKAAGIQPRSKDGEVKAIDSTIFFKGVIQPGQPATIEVVYSIPIKDPSFVYTQPLAYPLETFEIVVPLETRFQEKLPRLTGVGLQLPGAKPEDLHVGFDAPGFRPDKEFLVGKVHQIPASESIRFRLYNLPYRRPLGPWIALGLGLLVGLGILGFAAKERRAPSASLAELRSILQEERHLLLDQITHLDARHAQGLLTEATYQVRSLSLRSRLALVLQKLETLEPAEPAA